MINLWVPVYDALEGLRAKQLSKEASCAPFSETDKDGEKRRDGELGKGVKVKVGE